MKLLNYKILEAKLDVKEIKWSFNPPTAPWWGGWWERLVKTLKDLLKRMIGTAKLTKPDLERCLWGITHTINNRPLTTLTEDSEDLAPLTPAMFMGDLPISGLPEREAMTQGDLRRAYKKLNALKEALQHRFRKKRYKTMLPKRERRPVMDVKSRNQSVTEFGIIESNAFYYYPPNFYFIVFYSFES